MDLNKVMIIGRLTRDPETRTTPQGVTVANFGVATNRVWKDQSGNQQDRTEFHNVVAWRRLGEICAQYLRKGRQVYIEGHLQTRNWEDQSGKKQYRTEIVADNMIMLGNKGDTPGAPATAGAAPTYAPVNEPVRREPVAAPVGAAPTTEEEIRIEDIPF
jgi:single-strand DNA-binding protein